MMTAPKPQHTPDKASAIFSALRQWVEADDAITRADGIAASVKLDHVRACKARARSLVEGYDDALLAERDRLQEHNAELVAALEAIRARFAGVYDHPALVAFGALSTSSVADADAIARAALARTERGQP